MNRVQGGLFVGHKLATHYCAPTLRCQEAKCSQGSNYICLNVGHAHTSKLRLGLVVALAKISDTFDYLPGRGFVQVSRPATHQSLQQTARPPPPHVVLCQPDHTHTHTLLDQSLHLTD